MKTRLLLSFAIIIALSMLMVNTSAANSAVDGVPTAGENSQNAILNLVENILKTFGIGDTYGQPVVAASVDNSVINQQPELTFTLMPELTATPEQTQTSFPTATSTAEPTYAPTLLPTNTATTEPTPTTAVITYTFPTVEEFAADVRSQGMQGIWAENLFAFQFYNASWGSVPGSMNTAALSSYQGYDAFFIHNYLGGSKLYSVGSGTSVAVIWQDRIDWYQITGAYRIAGTNTGNGCEYAAPFSDWNGGKSYSAMDIISKYYSSPFAIQTCLCSGGKAGVYILTGA